MKRFPLRFLPVLAFLCAPLTGCSSPDDGGGGGGGGEGELMDYSNGLSAGEREVYYHLAEGSEVLPTAWVRAVRDTATKKPFMENLERFGFMPDPNNPHGLPVGMTDTTTLDTRLFGVRMMGLNCAACHVNDVTYRGRTIRIDGAPSLLYADKFKADLQGSLKHTLTHPLEFIGFLLRLRREHEKQNLHLPAPVAQSAGQVLAALPAHESLTAEHASAQGPLQWVHRAIEAERAKPPVDMLVGLQVGSPGGGANAARLPEPLTGEHALRTAQDLVPDNAHPNSLLGHPVRDVEHFIADVILTYRLMKARLHSFRRIIPEGPYQLSGPGRVDAFDVARNTLFPQDFVPTNAPVSYPFLWGMAEQNWMHYDGNTNSVMQRNMGQAIGVGAVYDSTTLISTLLPQNIYQMELLSRKIESPKWPEELFGKLDANLVSRGGEIFQQQCVRCHNAQTPDPLVSNDSTKTDPRRLENFAIPMNDGRPFTAWAAHVLDGLAKQAYRVNRVPPDSVRIMDQTQNKERIIWRTTSMWSTRPLNGMWATAPYLHNNSVPTLYDLLLPAAQRPKKFVVGHREYDPVKVGYAATGTGPLKYTFDTSNVGNSNAGHEYGTNLSDADRKALLEYLKSL